MSRRNNAVGLAFLLAYFLPTATGFYIFYLAWTNWVEDWHWALKVPACFLIFGAWVGILRIVLMMLLAPLAALVAGLFARSPALVPADRAVLARTLRKHLLIGFAAGMSLLVLFLMNREVVASWVFLAAMALAGCYYSYTFIRAATLVWGGWWASGALVLTMLLNRGPLAILSGAPLVVLLFSLTKAARQPGTLTENVAPQ